MCNTMQELSGTKNAIKLGGTGNHLSDTTLRRPLAKTLEQERPRHLWFSLRCGSCCTPVPTSTTNRRPQKQTEREKRRRLQQEYKGALELARWQIGLGGDVHWEWPDQCAAWNLDFIQKGMRELCLKTTTATGCSLGVRHPFSGKLVAQKWRIASTSKRLLDRITLSCQARRSSTP